VNAAKVKGVESATIDTVNSWTPEDEDERQKEDEVPEPPEAVKQVYQTATKSMEDLKLDPHDPMVHAAIEEFNNTIKQLRGGEPGDEIWEIPVSFFQVHYDAANTASKDISRNPTGGVGAKDLTITKQLIDTKIERCYFPSQWSVSSTKEVAADAAPRQKIEHIKDIVESTMKARKEAESLFKDFMTEVKAVPDKVTEADVQKMNAAVVKAKYAEAVANGVFQKAQSENTGEEDQSLSTDLLAVKDAYDQATEAKDTLHTGLALLHKAKKTVNATRPWDYPWYTQKTGHGDWTIVGTSRHGGNGHYVLVESMAEGTDHEGNRIPYQKWVSASEVGLACVDQYNDAPNRKNLAEDSKGFSIKDRKDFEKLLCVTDGRTKLHNSATGGKEVPSKCTIKFKTKGIAVLSASTFYRVVGETLGRALVRDLCKCLGFPAPWEREPVAIVYDPRKLGKNKVANFGRRIDHGKPAITEQKDGGATIPGNDTTSRSPSPAQDDQRIKDVEAKIATMQGTMETKMNQMRDQMNKDVTELKTTVTETNGRVDKIENVVNQIDTRMSTMEAQLKAIFDMLKSKMGPPEGSA
jgi:hypothetical protein